MFQSNKRSQIVKIPKELTKGGGGQNWQNKQKALNKKVDENSSISTATLNVNVLNTPGKHRY